jgi:hypothetical protein
MWWGYLSARGQLDTAHTLLLCVKKNLQETIHKHHKITWEYILISTRLQIKKRCSVMLHLPTVERPEEAVYQRQVTNIFNLLLTPLFITKERGYRGVSQCLLYGTRIHRHLPFLNRTAKEVNINTRWPMVVATPILIHQNICETKIMWT